LKQFLVTGPNWGVELGKGKFAGDKNGIKRLFGKIFRKKCLKKHGGNRLSTWEFFLHNFKIKNSKLSKFSKEKSKNFFFSKVLGFFF